MPRGLYAFLLINGSYLISTETPSKLFNTLVHRERSLSNLSRTSSHDKIRTTPDSTLGSCHHFEYNSAYLPYPLFCLNLQEEEDRISKSSTKHSLLELQRYYKGDLQQAASTLYRACKTFEEENKTLKKEVLRWRQLYHTSSNVQTLEQITRSYHLLKEELKTLKYDLQRQIRHAHAQVYQDVLKLFTYSNHYFEHQLELKKLQKVIHRWLKSHRFTL